MRNERDFNSSYKDYGTTHILVHGAQCTQPAQRVEVPGAGHHQTQRQRTHAQARLGGGAIDAEPRLGHAAATAKLAQLGEEMRDDGVRVRVRRAGVAHAEREAGAGDDVAVRLADGEVVDVVALRPRKKITRKAMGGSGGGG